MESFKERLDAAMHLRHVTAAELSRASGVNAGAISQYLSGAYKASQKSLNKLSSALNVEISWLMGEAVSMTRKSTTAVLPANPVNILPKNWPVLGATACGSSFHKASEAEIIVAPDTMKADFVFQCIGDSMIGARIFDGDWVFVRLQPDVENGRIAVVRVGKEYMLKRVYKEAEALVLLSENPKIKPMVYSGKKLQDCEIIGLAVEFLSKVK